MVAVPEPAGVTIPVPLTVPTAVLELLHTPPPVKSVKEVVDPIQKTSVPVMLAGNALTVTAPFTEQPVGNV